MSDQSCVSCQKPKSQLQCEICKSIVCKQCAQFLDENYFSFLSKVPEDLRHTTYCESCYNEKVAPQLETYHHLMEQAKNIIVYDKDQSKETRLLKRTEKPVSVKDCADYEETVLRLAFFAVQAGFNAIIDVDIKSQKVRTGAYQTTMWSGTGVPAHVQANRILKDRSLWQNPN